MGKIQENREFDVIVVGGGPAGCAAAISSARDLSAAVSVRSSSDSGRTMRCLLDLARAMMLSMSVMLYDIYIVLYFLHSANLIIF